MRKILIGLVASAVILGAATGFASAADQYPPCKSRSDDRCTQTGAMMPTGMHKEGMMKKEHKAKAMGHKVKMKMEPAGAKMKGAAGPGGIPHGCSPATTPCQ